VKFTKRGTGQSSVSALFDLLTEVGNGDNPAGLHRDTVTRTGIIGFEAMFDVRSAFYDLHKLYREKVKAQWGAS